MTEKRDWGGYRALAEAAREIAKNERETPPVACPNDGTPLEVRGGIANCPMGDYRITVNSRAT